MKKPAPETRELISAIISPERPRAERRRFLDHLHKSDPDTAAEVGRALLEQTDSQHQALRQCQEIHQKLEETVASLQGAPLHPALFLQMISVPHGRRALVQHGAARHLVGLDPSIDPDALATGQTVFLSKDYQAILALAPRELMSEGEICSFERRLSHGRLLVKWRDEEMVALADARLLTDNLQAGDSLVWNRDARIVVERLQREADHPLFLLEQPGDTFERIGGLDEQIETIQRALSVPLQKPQQARDYQMPRVGAILLEGPPGTGKTMIARALAHWLSTLVPGGRALFMNIKPAALHTPYYAEAERNYREAFRTAREAGARNHGVPVVMFFDEIDAIGAQRGRSLSRTHDNVLMALLAELNGLEDRGNVVVVAATNRCESLDASLVRPGRLGDLIVSIPRPNARAAHEILRRHVPAEVPFAAKDQDRTQCIQAVISRLYTPNGDNKLATITFRNGATRDVHAADVVNGAVLANIARRALTRACYREIDTGSRGVSSDDFGAAMDLELAAATRMLTPGNCRHHLQGLPQDLDVVRVEPVRRRRAAWRDLRAA